MNSLSVFNRFAHIGHEARFVERFVGVAIDAGHDRDFAARHGEVPFGVVVFAVVLGDPEVVEFDVEVILDVGQPRVVLGINPFVVFAVEAERVVLGGGQHDGFGEGRVVRLVDLSERRARQGCRQAQSQEEREKFFHFSRYPFLKLTHARTGRTRSVVVGFIISKVFSLDNSEKPTHFLSFCCGKS